MKRLLRSLVFLLVLVCVIHVTRADWTVDGNPVSTAADLQMNPAIISDGGTGAIIAWQDRRDGTSFNIYVQRVDVSGNPLWTVDGVAVCLEANDQTDPRIVSDGAGGAIVTWEDARTSTNFDIYAQRVDASGVPQWTTDGVELCVADFNQHNPTIAPDGVNGAIVVWQDHRNGTPDIYAQRVDDSGNVLWDIDGVALCTATRHQLTPVAIEDGLGGAIAVWVDRRAGLGDIYAQRVDMDGTMLWTANGVALCTEPADQAVPVLTAAGDNGAVVAWADQRSGDWDIYVNHLDSDGNVLPTIDGIAVCTATGDQNNPVIASVGFPPPPLFAAVFPPKIVAWEDTRSGNSDIYASSIGEDGSLNGTWAVNGNALCTAPLNQVKPTITHDLLSGAVVAWQDHRPNFHVDVYAQRVDAYGSQQWESDGVRVCGASGDQYDPVVVFADAGAAIVVWEDLRSGTYDVYAQRALGPPNAVAIVSFDAVTSDDGVALRAAFRSGLDVQGVNVYRGGARGSLTRIANVADAENESFEYTDRDVTPGRTYRYQIGVVDADGEFFSPAATVSVAELEAALEQNRPNPFNPSTTIRFVLPERGHVSLVIYDSSGRKVRSLLDEMGGDGAHEVTWDGRDDRGGAQSSGVYFYRLQTGKHIESRKMVLLK